MSDSRQYTLRWRGRQSGPFSLAQLNQMLDDHEIGMGHEICSADKWITLEEFFNSLNPPEATPVRAAAEPDSPVVEAASPAAPRATLSSSGVRLPGMPQAPIAKVPANPQPAEKNLDIAPATAAQPPPPALPLPPQSPRRRLVYAALAIVGGFVGLHNYYARNWLTGLLQLLLSIATILLGFGIIASWLWAVVEAIAVRKDGYGYEMT